LKLVEKLAPSQDRDAEKRGPGRPEGLKKKAAKELPIPGKNDAAKQKTLDRRLKIANIDAAARQAAREAGFADSQTKMSQIAREPTPKAQRAAVEAMANGSWTPPPAPKSGGDEPPLVVLKNTWKKAKDLKAAWDAASSEDRRRFIIEDLEYPLDDEPAAEDEE
jgi:hypothetical protein